MIRYFDHAEDAKMFRDMTGCGGWIFHADNGTAALFPFSYTPSRIFKHAITNGVSGKLM